MPMWIIDRDSYLLSHIHASFSPRSGHIFKIASDSIVGIIMKVLYPGKILHSPAEIGRKICANMAYWR